VALAVILLGVLPGTSLPGIAAPSNQRAHGAPVHTFTPIPTDTETPTVTPTATDTAVPTPTRLPTSTAIPTQTSTLPPSPTVTLTRTGTALPATPIPEPAFPQHHVVLIVIDAGRPQDLTQWKLPHIQALMKSGTVYDRAYVGQLLSSTPGVHVTFGTGTLPRENGFLGFGWAAPDSRKQEDFRTLLADGQVETVLRHLPEPSVAARLHQFFPGAIAVAASGHKDYATVGLGGGSADYELYGKYTKTNFVPTFLPGHTPPALTAAERKSLMLPPKLKPGQEDAWAFRYATIVARHVKPRLLMMNLPEMDTWGHWDGPDDQAVFHMLMLNIDRGIGQLEDTYRQLGILNNTDFIITADHAMMESKGAKDWNSVFTAASAIKVGIARADEEAGGIWLQDPTQAKAMADQMVKEHPAHMEAIFYRSAPGNDYHYILDSPASWLLNQHVVTALQHLVDTTAGQDGPDVWALYHENYTVVSRNVAGTWKGTHGGATWKVQHVPLVISGPGVRKGVTSHFAARAIDIAPTMERLLGLPSYRRDGIVLADALLSPTETETRAQKAIAPIIGADVTALRQQTFFDDSGKINWPTVRKRPPCGPKLPCTSSRSTATNS
jgi:predicted AlkP superfamily pyrophosphatase or phosphodiesterase